jgi:hypothetical protein
MDEASPSARTHVLEQHRRAALGEQPRLDLGHLKDGRDRLGHPDQFAGGRKRAWDRSLLLARLSRHARA